MKLWADFNEDRGGVVWTSLHRAGFIPEGEPRIGQWIELWDHEGNTCRGVVTSVNYPIVYLELDTTTWKGSDTVQIEPEFVGKKAPYEQGRDDKGRTGTERIPVGGFS